MKEKILNNLPLKIISVIIAIVIWYVVTSVSDPIVTRTFPDIPVQITNESYIAEGKKTYQISEQYQSIAVSIRGNRSVVNGITEDDITVTAPHADCDDGYRSRIRSRDCRMQRNFFRKLYDSYADGDDSHRDRRCGQRKISDQCRRGRHSAGQGI